MERDLFQELYERDNDLEARFFLFKLAKAAVGGIKSLVE